jgi:signal transduction histidine kinase/DNA-binding response OmpR family regulator
VEDNPGDARLIQEMIRGVPEFQFSHVETLSAALESVQTVRYGLILLDLTLPDSNGFETLQRVIEVASDAPIVVLTGYDDEHQGIEAVQAGAQDYLVKGNTDSRTLQRAIRYAHERYQIELALRQREEEYRSLIEDVFATSAVAVLILDREFKVVWLNEATEIYFGISKGEVLRQDKRVLIKTTLKCVFVDPDDYETRILRAYDGQSFSDEFECLVTPASSRNERWLLHWSQPIHSGMFAGGRIEQYTDITLRKKAELEEQKQRAFVEALRATAEALTSTLEFEDVLDRIIENVNSVVPNHGVRIVLHTQEGMRVVRKRGNEEGTTPPIQRISAPIILQELEIGVIEVYSQESEMDRFAQVDRLKAFAAQAAIAIQNSRLYLESQELATFQERQRLARELHDSVSQTLFSSQTMAEAALRQWKTNPEKAHRFLEEVYHLVISASAEMRLLLLELRPSSLNQAGLKQLFENYLYTTVNKQNINLHLEIADIQPLPPDVQIALYRIVQEAVNNVIKHANAQEIVLKAIEQSDTVILCVQDDGKGFSNQARKVTSFGLDIMRERAKSIQAEITISSEEGHGTQITVIWRRYPKENL